MFVYDACKVWPAEHKPATTAGVLTIIISARENYVVKVGVIMLMRDCQQNSLKMCMIGLILNCSALTNCSEFVSCGVCYAGKIPLVLSPSAATYGIHEGLICGKQS